MILPSSRALACLILVASLLWGPSSAWAAEYFASCQSWDRLEDYWEPGTYVASADLQRWDGSSWVTVATGASQTLADPGVHHLGSTWSSYSPSSGTYRVELTMDYAYWSWGQSPSYDTTGAHTTGQWTEQSPSFTCGAADPSITSSPSSTMGAEGINFSYTVSASHPTTGEDLVFAFEPETSGISHYPQGMTLDPYTGAISWTPVMGQTGLFPVVVSVTDEGGEKAYQAFLMTISENTADKPSISTTPGTSGTDGQLYTYDIDATDPNSDPLTYQILGSPVGMTIDANTGLLSWVPQPSQIGEHTVAVRALDTQGLYDEQRFTITVGDPSVVLWPEEVMIARNQIYLGAGGTLTGKATVYDKAQEWDDEVINDWSTVLTGTVTAETIQNNGEIIGLARYNTLWGYGSIQGTSQSPITVPVALTRPHFQHATPGTTDVSIAASQTQSLSAGAYQDITLSAGTSGSPTVLSLSGGTYHLRNLSTGAYGRVECEGTCQVRVQNNFILETDSYLGPSSTSTEGISGFELFVEGQSGAYFPVELSEDSIVQIRMSTLGRLLLESGVEAEGTFVVAQADVHGDVSIEKDPYVPPPMILSTPIFTADAGAAYSYDVEVNLEGLSFTLPTAPASMSIHPSTGLIAWSPQSADVGGHTIVVRATQSSTGLFDEQTFTLQVQSANQAPVIDSTPITSATEDLLYSYTVTATDPDVGDTLTFSLVQWPSGMTIGAQSGLIQWTPLQADLGDHSITVRVEDLAGAYDTQSFTLTVSLANDAPIFSSTAPTSATEGTAYTYTAQATDEDVGDVLSFSLVIGPFGTTIDPQSGLVTWTPRNSQVGDNTFIIQVQDQLGAFDTQQFTVSAENVNGPPKILSSAPLGADAQALYTYDVDAVDTDPSDTLTYSLSTAPSGMSIDAQTGLISWTPTLSQLGAQSATVQVTDALGLFDTQSFSIEVIAKQAPLVSFSTDKAMNLASVHSGASLVSVSSEGASNLAIYALEGGATNQRWETASGQIADQSLIVQLSGPSPILVSQFVLEGVNNNKSPLDYEIQLSDSGTQPEDFQTVVTAAYNATGAPVTHSIDPVPAQYARLLIKTNQGGTAVAVERFEVLSQAREGGIVSYPPGGATLISPSGQEAALDVRSTLVWNATPLPASLIVELVDAPQLVDRVRVRSTSNGLQNFEIRTSSTTTDPGAFTMVAQGTAPNLTYRDLWLSFTPTAARYVELVVLDGYGASNGLVRGFEVYAPMRGGRKVPFVDRTSDPYNPIVSWRWNFGDGSTSTKQHPIHTYLSAGTYPVTLTVTNSLGLSSSSTMDYVVRAAPVASFSVTPNPPTEGSTVLLTDTSQSSLPIVERDFGTSLGTSGTLANHSFQVAQQGPVEATLKVENADFLTDTAAQIIDVQNGAPTVFVDGDKTVVWGEEVLLGAIAFSDPAAADQLLCSIDWGDGSSAESISCGPSVPVQRHAYAAVGQYIATVTAVDDYGAISSAGLLVHVVKRAVKLRIVSTGTASAGGQVDVQAQLLDGYDGTTAISQASLSFDLQSQSSPGVTDAQGLAQASLTFSVGSNTVSVSYAGDALYEPALDVQGFDVSALPGTPVLLPLSRSSRGTSFVLAFSDNSLADKINPGEEPRLFVSSHGAVDVTIDAPGFAFSQTLNLTQAGLTEVVLPVAIRTENSGIIEDKGILVTASQPIDLYGFDLANVSSDGFLAIPESGLSKDYVVAAFDSALSVSLAETMSELVVVGVEDSTAVTIVPSADSQYDALSQQVLVKGQPVTFHLDRGQTVQLHAVQSPYPLQPSQDERVDLTGSVVLSDKKVALFGGSQCAFVPYNGFACDHLIEQIPPQEHLGTQFVIRQYAQRIKGTLVRVIAAHDSTQITVEGTVLGSINRAEFFEYEHDPKGPSLLVTSQPALVVAYAQSHNEDSTTGDPMMVVVPPIENYGHQHQIHLPDLITIDGPVEPFLGMVAQVSHLNGLLLDGQPLLARWQPVTDGTYAAAEVPVALGDHVVSHIDPNARFHVMGYVWRPYESVGFTGRIEDPLGTPACIVTVGTAGDGIDNDCDGQVDEESGGGTDDDGDTLVDEDLASGQTLTNLAPAAHPQSISLLMNAVTPLVLTGNDPNGDALSFDVTVAPSNGTLSQYVPGSSSPPALGALTNVSAVISYVPSSGFTGTDSFSFVASDGSLSSSAVTVTLTVGNAGSAPIITSTPVTLAVENQLYSYPVTLFEPDGDLVTASLPIKPSGMQMAGSQAAGYEVRWTPSDSQIGTHLVQLEIKDPGGLSDLQAFQVTVQNVPDTPQITSVPMLSVQENQLWSYDIVASDPDPGAVLSYALITAPSGMSLLGQTVSWTPQTADVGLHPVDVRVQDETGLSITQSFTLQVLPFVNSPPVIVSSAVVQAVQDQPYSYLVAATDLDAQDVLDFFLLQSPQGMAVDSVSGLISWTPSSMQVGSHTVEVAVSDGAGGIDTQSFVVAVQDVNDAPQITSTPPLTAAAGGAYSYNIQAFDPDNEPVSFYVSSGPSGMTVNQSTGLLSWTALQTGSVPVTVGVRDAAGASDSQSFTIVVSPDVTSPVVSVTASPQVVDPSQPVLVTVQTTDNVGVTARSLTIDGTPVTLDGAGQASVTFAGPGLYTATGQASDAASNSGSAAITIAVRDPLDTTPPTVAITSPLEGAVITAPTDIVGTADDANLVSYTLSIAKGERASFVPLVTSKQAVVNGVLGQFDPTLLENGQYRIKLEAIDINGASDEVVTTVQVQGNMKIGVFTLSFVDLQIPVSGIPITVTRTYDSRIKTKEDFGIGWTLDVAAGRYEHNRAPGEGWQITQAPGGPFSLACTVVNELSSHRTEVRLSDREFYTFAPVILSAAPTVGGCVAQVGFTQVGGLTPGATLQPLGNDIVFNQTGIPTLLDDSTLLPWAPDRVRLMTYDGRMMDFDRDFGLIRLEELNGNELFIGALGITHSSGKSIAFSRDGKGRVTKITDPMGHELKYIYDVNGDLAAFVDQEGYETSFLYDARHNLVEIVNQLGVRAVRSEYDDKGRLVATIDADGKRIDMNHDLAVRRETVTNRLSEVTYFDYDTRGNVVQENYPDGSLITRSFDIEDNVTSITNELGRTTTFTYDQYSNKLTWTNPLGETSTTTYTTLGKIATLTDARGALTTYNYDGKGNLRFITDPESYVTERRYDSFGNMYYEQGPRGFHKTFNYNVFGDVIREIDERGAPTDYTYDANGMMLTRTTTRSIGGQVETLTTTFALDARGEVVRTDFPDGSITGTTYDAASRVIQQMDQLGRVTTFSYDNQGRRIGTLHPDGTTDAIDYDAEGRIVGLTDRGGRKRTVSYDSRGRVQAVAFVDGTTLRNEYDLVGHLTAMVDPKGHRTEYDYDFAGRMTVMRDALLNEMVKNYDATGNLVSVTNAKGQVTNFEYDLRGLQTRIIYNDGTEEQIVYDEVGNIVEKHDQEDHITGYSYDAANNLVAVTDATSRTWLFAYDELGNRISQTDPNNHTTTFTFDEMGRELRRTLVDGLFQDRSYDARGNLAMRGSYSGLTTTTFTYDDSDRLSSRSATDMAQVSFGFTPTGRRNRVLDVRGYTDYVYDANDRLAGLIYPDGTSLTYVHDNVGNLTSMDAVGGGMTWTETYSYTERNELKTVAVDGLTFTLGYDATGKMASVTYPNGLTTIYTYDGVDRLMSIVTTDGLGTTVSSFAYTRYPDGQIDTITEADGTLFDYDYDAANRLVQATVTTSLGALVFAEGYDYDTAGNRTVRYHTPPASAVQQLDYIYDVRDRIQSDGIDTYGFDDDGRMVMRSGSNGLVLSWNSEDQLCAIDFADSTVANHVYDADGVLTQTMITPPAGTSSVTRHLVDLHGELSHIVADIDGDANHVMARYVRAGDMLLAVLRPSGVRYFHGDHIGSVQQLSDAAGAVTDSYSYDPFGILLAHQGADPNPYKFAGERFGGQGLLSQNRARWMLPEIGAFLSTDPWDGDIRMPFTLGRYGYASSNPVWHVDPTGNVAVLASVAINAGFDIGQSSLRHLHTITSGAKTLAAAAVIACAISSVSSRAAGRNLGPCGNEDDDETAAMRFEIQKKAKSSGGAVDYGSVARTNNAVGVTVTVALVHLGTLYLAAMSGAIPQLGTDEASLVGPYIVAAQHRMVTIHQAGGISQPNTTVYTQAFGRKGRWRLEVVNKRGHNLRFY